MLSCLLKSHWTDTQVSKICLSSRPWPTPIFEDATSVSHLNETGSSLIIQSFPWALHTLWNSSSEEKFTCLLSEFHMESLNRQLLNPRSTRASAKINLLWSDLQQCSSFAPSFGNCPHWTSLLPWLWWCGISSMKICPTSPLDSEQLGPDQEEDSQGERQDSHLAVSSSGDLGTRISVISIGFTLNHLWIYTNIVQRESTRSLGLPFSQV